MSITEMKTAIRKLPPSEVSELMTWLERYHAERWDKHVDEPEDDRFDSLIAEAYDSGEPSPLTKDDINEARRIVKDRIAARNSGK